MPAQDRRGFGAAGDAVVLLVTDLWPSRSEPFAGSFVLDEVRHADSRFPHVVVVPRLVVRRGHMRVWGNGIQGWQDKQVRPPLPHRLHRYPFVRIPAIGEGAVRAASIGARLRLAHERPAIVHAHFLLGPAPAAVRIARARDLPLVLTAHGTDVAFLEGDLPQRLRAEMEHACRAAKLVLAVSDDLRDRLAAVVPEARIEVLPMGVDSEVFRPQAPGNGVPNLPYVLFAGRATSEKGILVLEEATGLLRTRGIDVPVLVAGTTEVELQHAQPIGVLARGDMARWMSGASVTCLPSYAEGSPLVVAESLASGTPVVASAVGGIPAQVRHGVNGLLVEPGNAVLLADALAAALGRSWPTAEIRASSEAFWCSSISARLSRYYEELLSV